MANPEKHQLNLRDPEDAQAWIDGFKARCRAEKKTDTAATTSAPQDYQITDQFLFRCGVESLKKVKTLVAPNNIEDMPFKDIEDTLNFEKIFGTSTTTYNCRANEVRVNHPEQR